MTVNAESTLQVLELGLACCAVEAAAVDLVEDAIAHLPEPQSVKQISVTTDTAQLSNILVVAGTITKALIPTVQKAYESLAEPRVVIAFGVCAISGGPYWDSYSVVNGADELIPVDVMVPGCPPAPEDLAKAIATAQALVSK